MLHEGGGVCNILGPSSVTESISFNSLTLLDFPPYSKRRRGSDGKVEGEVSDPPFFVPRTSRKALPCNTPCNTPVPCGGVAHFSVTVVLIPAGRLG